MLNRVKSSGKIPIKYGAVVYGALLLTEGSFMAKSDFLEEKITDNTTQGVVRMLVVESEQKYKALVDNALVGIYIIDVKDILYANPFMLELVGYSNEEIQKMLLRDIIEPSCWEMVKERVMKRLSGESRVEEYELKLVHKDGNTVDVKAKGVRCMYKGAHAVLGTMVDIGEKKKIDAKMRVLEDTVENVPISIVQIDILTRVSYINQEAVKLLNYKQKEIIGTPLEEILIGKNSDKIVTNLLEKSQKRMWKGTLTFSKMDGQPLEMQVSTISIKDKDNIFAGVMLFLTPMNY